MAPLPRTILITGASSGIGTALALGYAAPGVTLLLTGRDVERLTKVATQCRMLGAVVEVASIDLREKPALTAWIEAMDAATPIDLVIANAGISSGSFAGNETFEAAETLFDVNVTGVLTTIHPLIPRMVARGRGQVAIMSSLAGICALPSAPSYSASKAAMRYYGDALRGQLTSRNVHVSVICPGWIATPLTANNNFPMPFLMPAERAARIIIRGLRQKKSRIAFPFILYFLLRTTAILPVFASDFLLRLLPNKRLKP